MADPYNDDDLLGDGGTDDGAADGDGDPLGDPSTQGEKSKSTDKRVADLQSKADKETARANKAEKRLAVLETALKAGDTEGGKPAVLPSGDSAAGAIMDAMLDMARTFAAAQTPKLAEFGLTASDLTGSTPAEIAASATALIVRYEKMETQIRNKVLADNGLAPEIDQAQSQSRGPRDFSKMSSEDFKKVMDAALHGRV